MTDRWIITTYEFQMHGSLAAAEHERDRLALKVPEKTFRILRVKDTLTAGETSRKIEELERRLAATRGGEIGSPQSDPKEVT